MNHCLMPANFYVLDAARLVCPARGFPEYASEPACDERGALEAYAPALALAPK